MSACFEYPGALTLVMAMMRWFWISLESIACGFVAVFASFVLLVIALHVHTRYVLGLPADQTVGWDVISILGPNWRLVLIGTPLAIFAVGWSIGFWFFSRRVHR